MSENTLGAYRVGTTFNPSGDDTVNSLKVLAAEFIDKVDAIPLPKNEPHRGEVARLKSLAMAHSEDAAMWAVKAATKRPPA